MADDLIARAWVLDYLKRAFLSRWNLLLLLGAAAGAWLSPWPDALLPLVAAGELVYLGGLVSVPRFREAVDAQVAARTRAIRDGARPPTRTVAEMLAGLSADAQQRFAALRKRCLDMRSIAQAARAPVVAGDDEATDLWTPALDRLLYGFLRLLGQQNSLLRFLRVTTEAEITKGLQELRQKLTAAQAGGDDRMIHSLQESVAIAEQRLDNYHKAMKNADFAGIELDRVESKIQALIELAANRQDPNLLSSQVDAAAESMHRTTATLSQLQQIGGVPEDLDEVPAILDQRGSAVSRDS
jgi:hypothetical protein